MQQHSLRFLDLDSNAGTCPVPSEKAPFKMAMQISVSPFENGHEQTSRRIAQTSSEHLPASRMARAGVVWARPARQNRKEGAANVKSLSKQQSLHEVATQTMPASHSTKSRPPPLVLPYSVGCTETKPADLKQRICDGSSASACLATEVLLDNRPPLPPTPNSSSTMGNTSSALPYDHEADDKSLRSVLQRDSKLPMSRKGSFNIFKRVDSKSPLPQDVTPSVVAIQHPDNLRKDASPATCENDPLSILTASQIPQCDHPHGHYPDVQAIGPHSASTITMAGEEFGIPLSAASTIRDCRTTDQSLVRIAEADDVEDSPIIPPPSPVDRRVLSNLSPAIPAPSPLPEDSPHKYGLRDDMHTPEAPPLAPRDIVVTKMRRKSSGLEIFNEVKNLQSAQSFLNGLSTSRRRAESASATRTTEEAEEAERTGSRSHSPSTATRPSSTRPAQLPRQKGHNFKSSGFAYSRPLNLAQTKCYREHARLLPSRNKHAPVECAVCHIDDDDDFFSCSWCSLRMCRFCRKDFDERGMVALRERIRKAELGGSARPKTRYV